MLLLTKYDICIHIPPTCRVVKKSHSLFHLYRVLLTSIVDFPISHNSLVTGSYVWLDTFHALTAPSKICLWLFFIVHMLWNIIFYRLFRSILLNAAWCGDVKIKKYGCWITSQSQWNRLFYTIQHQQHNYEHNSDRQANCRWNCHRMFPLTNY